MQFFDSIEKIPNAEVRELALAHLAAAKPVVDAIREFACPLKGPSFHGRAEPEHAYKDDGNTRCPGTRYSLLWLWDLDHPGKIGAPAEWFSWHNGTLCYAIASEMDLRLRDQDGKKVWQGSEFAIGRWPNTKQERIDYSTHSTALNLSDESIASSVLLVRSVVERLKVLEAVRKLTGHGKEST